jgi:hypothetical protein
VTPKGLGDGDPEAGSDPPELEGGENSPGVRGPLCWGAVLPWAEGGLLLWESARVGASELAPNSSPRASTEEARTVTSESCRRGYSWECPAWTSARTRRGMDDEHGTFRLR